MLSRVLAIVALISCAACTNAAHEVARPIPSPSATSIQTRTSVVPFSASPIPGREPPAVRFAVDVRPSADLRVSSAVTVSWILDNDGAERSDLEVGATLPAGIIWRSISAPARVRFDRTCQDEPHYGPECAIARVTIAIGRLARHQHLAIRMQFQLFDLRCPGSGDFLTLFAIGLNSPLAHSPNHYDVYATVRDTPAAYLAGRKRLGRRVRVLPTPPERCNKPEVARPEA